MKLFGISTTSLLLMLLAGSVAGYSQERPEEGKPTQEQTRPERTPEIKPDTQENQKPEERKQDNAQRDENKQDKQAQDNDKKAQENDRKAQENDKKAQENRAQENRNDKGRQMSRANGKQSARIPDDKFRSHFGRAHTFAIRQPVIVNNQPRFQYGGYWFEIVDPWPAQWSYSDDCYIDYIDDNYYLIDPLHPGIQIALFVVM